MGNKIVGQRFLLLGLIILLTGIWGLWKDVPIIGISFYVFAWWGLIFLLDGFCVLKRNSSILTTRRKHLPILLFGSITFWIFFEMLNLRFQNWYYIGVIPLRSIYSVFHAAIFTFLAFGTVFVGMFEILEVVNISGLLKNWKGKPGKLPVWVSYAIQGVGFLMAFFAIVFPYWLAPLIWGSFSFIVDPWNYRAGSRSILRDIENKEWGVLSRLFVAGLVCGIVWESLNFLAPMKWVYTVRGLEHFKLFEMPLLGFLGFPGLMIDCLAAYSLIARFLLENQTWQDPQDITHEVPPTRPASKNLLFTLIPVQIFYWMGVAIFIMQVNIGSIKLDLDDLSELTPKAVIQLTDEKINSPIHLLRESPGRKKELREKINYTEKDFQKLLDQADLYHFKGIGSWYGPLLNELGIHRVEDLVNKDTQILHQDILKLTQTYNYRISPRLDMVKVWIYGAQSRSLLQRNF